MMKLNSILPTLLWTSTLFLISILACSHSSNPDIAPTSKILCSDSACVGTYTGPEFIKGSDVAHQFSNEMAKAVGDKLKSLYGNGHYNRVDFGRIQMSTKGMGTGQVIYSLSIPFLAVSDKCDAFTSFDHVGGWNHAPALAARKKQLQPALLHGDSLYISPLKTTPEGLQEYWIQWRNKEVQKECGQ